MCYILYSYFLCYYPVSPLYFSIAFFASTVTKPTYPGQPEDGFIGMCGKWKGQNYDLLVYGVYYVLYMQLNIVYAYVLYYLRVVLYHTYTVLNIFTL